MIKGILLCLLAALLLDVCGYKRAGKGKSLPPHIKTLAVPTFKNSSLKYRVEQRFTRAVVDEVLRRARALRVTNSTEGADAVLSGDIRGFNAAGSILDDQGRIRVWEVTIFVSVTVRDLKTNRILYSNPRMIFEGEYELSDDPQSFFNEENPAVDRISRRFAESIVSTIMEGR
jgi:hypothetical protein